MYETARIRARHYATGKWVDLFCSSGIISSVTPVLDQGSLPSSWIAPALFDLQINGCDGHSFNSDQLTVESVRHVVLTCRRHGIGGFLPTLVTNAQDCLLHGFRVLKRACEEDEEVSRAVPGFHLEGPYISPEDGPRGAHPRAHVRAPDWDEFQRFQDAASGRIRLTTLAPEHEGALAFIAKVVQSGVVVALGHTAATGQRIRDAVAAGARLCTHLGNGCNAMLPRHDNPIWPQLAEDQLWISVICDGHHLPPDVVRCFLRVKTPMRTVLTCDASSLAGLPAGKYRQWDQELEVLPSGKVVVPGTTYLAGSGSFTDICVGNVMKQAGVCLAEAVDMATARPRELLGLPPISLVPGSPADLVVFDWQPGGAFQVRSTVVNGVLHESPEDLGMVSSRGSGFQS